MECYASGKDDDGIGEMIYGLYEKAMSHPYPDDWLEKCIECYKNTDIEDIKNEIYAQSFGPVKWVDTVKKLKSEGVTKIYEIGLGKVLAGLAKKIDKELEIKNKEKQKAENAKDVFSFLFFNGINGSFVLKPQIFSICVPDVDKELHRQY